MATCPNKNSKEWKEVMLLAQNNEKLAMEMWVKKGYADKVSLNKEDTSGLSQKEIDNLEKDQEEKEELIQKTDLQTLAERTKMHLRRRIKALEKVKIKDARTRKSKLQKLLKNMEALNEIESINEFIIESYEKTEALMLNMEQIVDDAKSNPMDGSLVERLVEINNAVNGSEDVLKDIANNQDIVDFFNKESEKREDDASPEDTNELSIKDMLYKTLTNRLTLKRRVNVEAIPLIADWLISARSSYAKDLDADYKAILKDIEEQKKNFEEGKISKWRYAKIKKKQDKDLNLAKNVVVDKQDLINTLREASREDGVLDFMIGPAITSPDAVIALTAKALKDQLEKARLKDIAVKEDIAKAFIEYQESNSAFRDNPKNFNKGLYEIIEERTGDKDDEGNDIYREEVHFVSKFDMKKYKSTIRQWYKENPEPFL